MAESPADTAPAGAAVTVRGLAPELKARLRVRAAHNARSMEAEARAILEAALSAPEEDPTDLAAFARAVRTPRRRRAGTAAPRACPRAAGPGGTGRSAGGATRGRATDTGTCGTGEGQIQGGACDALPPESGGPGRRRAPPVMVLDTNVLSELARPDPDAAVLAWVAAQRRAELCTTAVSEAELAYGLALLPKGRRRDALAHATARLLGEGLGGRVLPFDRAAADAQIAATARARGASALATRDTGGFQGCGVRLVNPWGT